MINFDKEELLKIADLSALKLNNDEIESFVEQIKLVLNYTEQLNQVKLAQEILPIKNINIFREDKAEKKDVSKLLNQAPKTKDQYFVVPKVLK